MLLIGVSASVYGKGRSGSYCIKGIAHKKDKTILVHTTIGVRIGNEKKEVTTDDNGRFEFDVPWTSPCRSGINRHSWEKERKRLNPKFIYIKHGAAEIKLRNRWKKYSNQFKTHNKQQDLFFEE